MNTMTQSTYEPASTSSAAMLLVLQILPQLQVLKNCRDGWKAMADAAKDKIKMQQTHFAREKARWLILEEEMNVKISSVRMKMLAAYDERDNVKKILLGTLKDLHSIHEQSRIIAHNFNIEKENFMQSLNNKSKSILENQAFLKYVDKELRLLIVQNKTIENKSNFEYEIRNNLALLSKEILEIKKELQVKDNTLAETQKQFEECEDGNKNLKTTIENLQEELDEAKELKQELQEIQKEKSQLLDINENVLQHISSLLNDISIQYNKSLEMIFKETLTASKSIQKYIVEPAEIKYNITLKTILKNNTKEDAMYLAAKSGNVTEIAMLLDAGTDLEAKDSTVWGYTPLHWTAETNHTEALRLLLLRGANINSRAGPYNITPLHVGVNNNNLKIIDLLLKGGADIESRDDLGGTPLFWAAIRQCQTAELLVQRGANVSTTNYDGISAVVRATDCVRELLCSKAAADSHCSKNETYNSNNLP